MASLGEVQPSSASSAVINSYVTVYITTYIEENQICFKLGSYFMSAVWAAARYSRGGFSICHADSARCVMVSSGSMFHLEPGTIELLVWTRDGYCFQPI